MKIIVIGGTGLIGSKVVERLRAAGHEAIVAAPATGVDIPKGAGLDEAMAGTVVVVDLANSPAFDAKTALKFFETAGRNVLAEGGAVGVGHYAELSVVDTEKLSARGYFVGKAAQAQERLIRESGVPYTIVHSTQFLEFLPGVIQSGTEGETVRLPTAFVQPIAANNVADAVVRHALGAPANAGVDITGPGRDTMAAFAQRYMRATGDARPVIGDVHARYFGVELAPDTLVPAGAARQGDIGLDGWLKQSSASRQPARA